MGAGLALVVAGVLPGFLVASLAPRIRGDFALGDVGLGVAVAAFYLVSALSSTPAGRVVDRIGPRGGVRLAAATTAVSCLAVAVLADSAVALIALLVPSAVANAVMAPTVSTMLKGALPPQRQGLGFGVQQAGAPLGALLAGLALPALAIPLGWRWAFAATAVAAVAAALAVPPLPRQPLGGEPGRRPRGLNSVHAIGLGAAFVSTACVGLVSFLVVYSVDNGISETGAGVLLGAVSLAAALSRLGLGHLADRRTGDPLSPVVVMTVASAPAYVLLIAGEPAAIAAGALLASALGWAWPSALTLAVVQRSPDAPAWAVGVMMSGLFVGCVAGPIIVGVLAHNDLFSVAWLACAGFALLGAATIAAVRAAGSPAEASGTRTPSRSR